MKLIITKILNFHTFNLILSLIISNFICTIMSKNAEPRAEQQARLIAMPRRESSSAPAKERHFSLDLCRQS